MAESSDQGREERLQTPARGLVPIPDPSERTTAALEREIRHLREVIEEQLKGQAGIVDQRFVDMDKAIELLSSLRADQREIAATVVDRGVATVETLIESKLAGIEGRIADQDRRFEQSKLDSKAAIDAALQAAKEAVGKTEVVTDKQIAGIQVLVTAITANFEGKLEDLKERVNLSQGATTGAQSARAALYATIGIVVAVLGSVLGLIVFAISRSKTGA